MSAVEVSASPPGFSALRIDPGRGGVEGGRSARQLAARWLRLPPSSWLRPPAVRPQRRGLGRPYRAVRVSGGGVGHPFQDSPSYGFIQGVEVWRAADPAAAGGSMAPASLQLAPASGGATSTAVGFRLCKYKGFTHFLYPVANTRPVLFCYLAMAQIGCYYCW